MEAIVTEHVEVQQKLTPATAASPPPIVWVGHNSAVSDHPKVYQVCFSSVCFCCAVCCVLCCPCICRCHCVCLYVSLLGDDGKRDRLRPDARASGRSWHDRHAGAGAPGAMG